MLRKSFNPRGLCLLLLGTKNQLKPIILMIVNIGVISLLVIPRIVMDAR